MSHLAKPILQVGKPSPGPTLPPLAACWSRASPQPRPASRPWERRLRRHMEEALRELRIWGSGAGSGSSSGSSSGSGSAVGPTGRRAACPLSRTRSLRTQGGRGHHPRVRPCFQGEPWDGKRGARRRRGPRWCRPEDGGHAEGSQPPYPAGPFSGRQPRTPRVQGLHTRLRCPQG